MSFPIYPSPAAPLDTRGTELPQWAKIYRTILMASHTVGILAIVVLVIAYTVPLGSGMDGKAQMAWALLFIFLTFLIVSIPYTIGNIVYFILWITSLRGKGYRANKISSVYLVGPPILIGILTINYIQALFAA